MILKTIAAWATISALAAALIGAASLLTADVAHAGSNSGLLGPGALPSTRAAVGPAGLLAPPTGRGRPFRQIKVAECTGGSCILPFTTVPLNRVLQIDNVSCLTFTSATDGIAALTTSADTNGFSRLIAYLPPARVGGGRMQINQSGPYFFNAGERIFIHATGETGAICTISGLLSPTN